MNLGEVKRGWDVFSADGNKVGDVWEVRSHYIVVSKGFLFKSDRYVPASAISGVEHERVYLNVAKDQIEAQGWEKEPASAARLSEKPERPSAPAMRAEEGQPDREHEERVQGGRQPVHGGEVWAGKDVSSERETRETDGTRGGAYVVARPAERDPADQPIEDEDRQPAKTAPEPQPPGSRSLGEEREGAPATADLSSRTERPAAEQTAERADVEGRKGQAEARSADMAPLFPADQAQDFRFRWDEIQTAFVDEPRQAVEQADSLVAEVIKRLAESFAGERSKLEEQWGRGGEADTEDLRIALQRYRSFFDRLLSL
jgi:hypothetical protein